MQSEEASTAPPFHCGTVSIAGRPNVGKSTLLNILVDFKLSAVSPKPKTTRHKILGVLTGEGYQVAFLDTPGLPYRRHDELDRRLLSSTLEAIHEADLVVMMVEPKAPAGVERRLIGEIRRERKPAILAINKIDLVKKPAILPVMEAYSNLYPFLEIVPVSVLTLDGVGEWATSTIGHGQGKEISILRELQFPHSLGLLYSAFTYYCGFKVNSGEYKMMGLAPYGEPVYVNKILDCHARLRARSQ